MKTVFLYIMAIAYAAAGVNHFINPKFYTRIIPPWLPSPLLLVQVSGVCEILFGLLLIPAATRHMGAWLLILLLLAIFPANIQMAVNYWKYHNPYFWLTIVRLPLQLVLIWLAWLYTK